MLACDEGEEKMQPREKIVHMNIIIVGAGEIGRHLAIELSQGLALLGTQGEKLRESYSVTVIDSDPQLVAEMERVIDAKVICADGGTVEALGRANIAKCDLFLALTRCAPPGHHSPDPVHNGIGPPQPGRHILAPRARRLT